MGPSGWPVPPIVTVAPLSGARGGVVPNPAYLLALQVPSAGYIGNDQCVPALPILLVIPSLPALLVRSPPLTSYQCNMICFCLKSCILDYLSLNFTHVMSL